MFFCELLPIFLALSFEQIRARIASIISIINYSLFSVFLLSLAMASLGDISSSLVTVMFLTLLMRQYVPNLRTHRKTDGSSPGSVWPPGLSYMTTDVARDT